MNKSYLKRPRNFCMRFTEEKKSADEEMHVDSCTQRTHSFFQRAAEGSPITPQGIL